MKSEGKGCVVPVPVLSVYIGTTLRYYIYIDRMKLKTYPVLVFRALRVYVCLLLLRVVEARVLLR